MKSGTELILAERARQIAEEGWTAEHDDRHDNQQLREAGESYLLYARWQLGKLPACPQPQMPWERRISGAPCVPWPWAKRWWKPKQPVRNLTKAGALFLAEVDRQKRLTAPGIILRPLSNKVKLCARLIDDRQATGKD